MNSDYHYHTAVIISIQLYVHAWHILA